MGDPPLRILKTLIIHDDPLGRVERLELSEEITVRSEIMDGFQLTKRAKRDTVLSMRTRNSTLRTRVLYLVHTRLHTYLCAEDSSVNGKMPMLLTFDPQPLLHDQLLYHIGRVRQADVEGERPAARPQEQNRENGDSAENEEDTETFLESFSRSEDLRENAPPARPRRLTPLELDPPQRPLPDAGRD